MAEDYELTDPIVVPEIVTTKYKVRAMNLDFEAVIAGTPTNPTPQVGQITIRLRDNNEQILVCTYVGQEAIDMMKWMNTANFTVNSMQKRILQKLEQDGKIPSGDITGTPDPAPPVFE